jgi:hypothetical protein
MKHSIHLHPNLPASSAHHWLRGDFGARCFFSAADRIAVPNVRNIIYIMSDDMGY